MGRSADIIARAEAHVRRLFDAQLPAWAVYHNLEHTRETVRAAAEIADGSEVQTVEREVVLLAAWLHDTGYVEAAEGHETRSAEMARDFLHSEEYPTELGERIMRCILATRLPQSPVTLPEEILCDADVIHAGKTDLEDRSLLLRRELEERTGRMMSEKEWLGMVLAFVEQHPFHTAWARTHYGPQRERNRLLLMQRLRRV